MKKIFVIDTNVLLHDPRSLFAFGDNEVVIPLVVLDELDKKKVGGNDETSKHARMVIRSLDKMRDKGNIHEGVKTDAGGVIRVELNHIDNCPKGLDPSRMDNKLIGVTLGLKKVFSSTKIILITKDINLRVKCDALGISVHDYNADAVADNPDSIYTGIKEIFSSKDDIDAIFNHGRISVTDGSYYENQYVYMKSNVNTQHSALVKYVKGDLVKIINAKDIWGISARNMGQRFAFDALFDPNIKLVTLIGGPGVGKTLVSIASGISQTIELSVYKKLIMARPIIPVGKDLGYLPGTLQEKLTPWTAALQDNLNLLFSTKASDYLNMQKDSGKIEIEALTYIRGRSIPKSFIIMDECQNLSSHEVKTLITRAGEDTKIVLTGDIMQIDNPLIDSVDNGLSYVVEKFKSQEISAHITLCKGERSELATLASEIL